MTEEEWQIQQQVFDELTAHIEADMHQKVISFFIGNVPPPPQLSYPNTRQGAMQCFDDMTGQGYKLDLVRYHYYKP